MLTNEKYLPIGTVVILKKSEKKIMIIGFMISNLTNKEDTTVYDYAGCLYPEGQLSSSETLVFNHEDIKEICFNGYQDESEIAFKDKLNKLV